jgi:hypothetical protein
LTTILGESPELVPSFGPWWSAQLELVRDQVWKLTVKAWGFGGETRVPGLYRERVRVLVGDKELALTLTLRISWRGRGPWSDAFSEGHREIGGVIPP